MKKYLKETYIRDVTWHRLINIILVSGYVISKLVVEPDRILGIYSTVASVHRLTSHFLTFNSILFPKQTNY